MYGEAWVRTFVKVIFPEKDIFVFIKLLLCLQDFIKQQESSPIAGVDVIHQLWRLRHSKRMSDGEVGLIMRTLVENVQTYDQVTEVGMAVLDV